MVLRSLLNSQCFQVMEGAQDVRVLDKDGIGAYLDRMTAPLYSVEGWWTV